jgi:catalase
MNISSILILLDPTKIIPEEIVPVQRIGKNDSQPQSRQLLCRKLSKVAFHVGNIVPGIDFTNDPLMQGRLFSYTDTQLIRLGGPNFHEIPINRSCRLSAQQSTRWLHATNVNRGQTSYEPKHLCEVACPFQAGADMGGFTSFAERIDAQKIRARSASFFDHFSQGDVVLQ